MLNKISLFLALALIVFTSGAQAHLYQINTYDTEVKPSRSARGADGEDYSIHNWYPAIGTGFEVISISLEGDQSSFQFDINTDFGPNNDFYGTNSNETYLGDFFIKIPEENSYDYAFNLSALDLDASDSPGLYTVQSIAHSGAYFDSSYIYGDGYRARAANELSIVAPNEMSIIAPIVRMSNGTSLQSTEFTRSFNTDGSYTYTISGDFDLIEALDLSWGNSFEFIFATATCANSGMMGTVSTATPEPTTWLLFGTGILGLLAVGRKKVCNRYQT